MKKILLSSSLFMVLLFVLMFSVMLMADEDKSQADKSIENGTLNLSPEVLAHRPMVEKYCRQYDILDYIGYILAIIQVESGGTAEDVMQSSESLGLLPNSLSTEESIKQGTKYFSELLAAAKATDCDIDSVVQSYNYGGGFLSYVAENGRKYTLALAEAFAQDMSGGEKTDYQNPVAVSTNGGWRYAYGNMFYVQLVKQYLRPNSVQGGFLWPVPSYYGTDWITSTFGGRYNPVTGEWQDAHGAIDIGAPAGTAIYAAADGTISIAGWEDSYGNFVKIAHDDTYATLYAHCSRLLVTEGQEVKQGDTIALVGSTGQSTGAHLHFEVRENNIRIDPMQFFN